MTAPRKPVRSRKWPWITLIALSVLLLVAGSLVAWTQDTTRGSEVAHCDPATAKGRVGGSDGAGMLTMPQRDLDRELVMARDAGMWAIRVDVDWSRIEPVQGQRDWSDSDRVVETVVRHGMCPLGLVGYTPDWAAAVHTTDGHSRPADPAQFAEFAAAAAERYRDSVTMWEIWNEPNLETFFKPAPDIAAYGDLLTHTYPAMRAVRDDLWVIAGGMAPATDDGPNIAPITFLAGLYDGGVNQYLDAVAMHPYSYPALPDDPAEWNAAQQMWKMRDIMIAGGDEGKLIWITEFGAPTGTSERAVSQAVQARSVRLILQATTDVEWLGPAFVYSIRDSGDDTDDPEQNFGILQRDFTPKQAYAVVREFGTSARRRARLPATRHGHKEEKGGPPHSADDEIDDMAWDSDEHGRVT